MRTRTPWMTRLAQMTTSEYTKHADTYGEERETTLVFESASGFEYELEVTVCAEYEPGQNGGWDDPSWDGYWENPSAFWYRPGHGWKAVELTKEQKKEILSLFEDSAHDSYDGPSDDYDDYVDPNAECPW